MKYVLIITAGANNAGRISERIARGSSIIKDGLAFVSGRETDGSVIVVATITYDGAARTPRENLREIERSVDRMLGIDSAKVFAYFA